MNSYLLSECGAIFSNSAVAVGEIQREISNRMLLRKRTMLLCVKTPNYQSCQN